MVSPYQITRRIGVPENLGAGGNQQYDLIFQIYSSIYSIKIIIKMEFFFKKKTTFFNKYLLF